MEKLNEFIISRKDRIDILNMIADNLGCSAESVGRSYDVNTRTITKGNKEYHVANGLYLWVNRSGSLRELMENDMIFFPRYTKYLVMNNFREDKTILLYNNKIELNREVKFHLITETELSINVPNMSEAMRFINYDIIGKLFEDNADNLMNKVPAYSNQSSKGPFIKFIVKNNT